MTAIYMDTNVVVSAFESSRARAHAMWDILAAVDSGEIQGVTSGLRLAELLPKPLSASQTDLGTSDCDLLSGERKIAVEPVTRSVLLRSARLRSRYLTLKLPDAIHLATAEERGCAIVPSDDRRLPPLPGLNIVRPGPDGLASIMRFKP